jgi:CRP/FNR family transcriptional regulator, nitrogen fixation regulation protein
MSHLKRRRRDRKITWPIPGVDWNPFQSAIKLIGFSIPFLKNVEIYAESEPADYVYKVIGGAVRCYKILNDGRRQINAFYLPGDIFGLEIGGVHAFSAEALVDSKILLIKRSSLIEIATRDNRVARELWTLTAAELQRMQQHAVAFIMSAQERVVSFLVEIAKRGATASEVELLMPRADIADYLGLTIETVCRTLKQLEKSAAIELPTFHHVVLRKMRRTLLNP